MNSKILKIVAMLAVAGLVTAAYGQGVIFDNAGNSGSQTATTSGRVFMPDGSLFDGMTYNLGVAVFAGNSLGTMSLIGTYTPATDAKGYTGLDLGQFQLGPAALAVNIPGVSGGGTAYFELQVWFLGTYNSTTYNQASYAAAQASGGLYADVFFTTSTSNPDPPIPAGNFSTMPSFTLIPEPSTLALVGLGLTMLVACRRKRA